MQLRKMLDGIADIDHGYRENHEAATGQQTAKVAEGDGYAAALVNFRYIASAVWTTKEAVSALSVRSQARL